MESTPPATAPTLGSVIHTKIREVGFTIRGAALATGIPHSTLDRKIKTGGLSFTYAELERLAPLLGYDRVSDLHADVERAA